MSQEGVSRSVIGVEMKDKSGRTGVKEDEQLQDADINMLLVRLVVRTR